VRRQSQEKQAYRLVLALVSPMKKLAREGAGF
jgi:hypothetical protein